MGAKKTVMTSRLTPVTKLDREKFSAYCSTIGHTETSLSTAFSNASYLSHRFLKYDGTVPAPFLDWCNRVYPRGKDALAAAIIPNEPKPEPPAPKVEEQMRMELPSAASGKVVTIQPVAVVGFNQIVDVLREISLRLEALEKAWKGDGHE